MDIEKPLWEKFYENWLEGDRTGQETAEEIFRAGFDKGQYHSPRWKFFRGITSYQRGWIVGFFTWTSGMLWGMSLNSEGWISLFPRVLAIVILIFAWLLVQTKECP